MSENLEKGDVLLTSVNEIPFKVESINQTAGKMTIRNMVSDKTKRVSTTFALSCNHYKLERI